MSEKEISLISHAAIEDMKDEGLTEIEILKINLKTVERLTNNINVQFKTITP